MYLAYPCIKMDAGCHAWSFFTKILSQKVCHMRHNLKVKSQEDKNQQILFDFSVRYVNDRLKETSDNLKKVVGACYLLEVKEPINVEGNDTMLNVVTYIENSTNFDRNGKGGDSHFKSIITVFYDLEDVQIKKKLETQEKVPPNLIIFRNHGINAAAYIVGGDTTVRCQGSIISAAMLELLAVYYIFDIDYPKCYAVLLGFLQIFVMNEPFVHETLKKCKFFTKKNQNGF